MSPDEFKAYRPRSEDEIHYHEKEADFRKWCNENDEDPTAQEARDSYEEIQEETGDKFWDNLDPNDRAGWEDNMSGD